MKKIAFIFPGQGSQSTGMGLDLCENFEAAKEVYKTATDAETLKTKLEELSKVSNEIFSKLYANAGANAGAGTDGNADNAGSTDPNNFSDFTTK